MIINTGQRTDIPAFYSEWFFNRIKAGYVCVRNPYNPNRITRYTLDSKIVDILSFCTKNPQPMLARLEEIREFGQYWFVTITGYGKDIEPNVPNTDDVVWAFWQLSEMVGVDCVVWRYDPILLTDRYNFDYHLKRFEEIAKHLQGAVNTVVISFLDLYAKVVRNFREVRMITRTEKEQLGKALIEIAQNYGMRVRTCHEGCLLERYGADCNGCMTIPIYEKAIQKRLTVPAFRPSREGCACYLSNDIGAYDTCMHLCRYCYANNQEMFVKQNYKKHNINSSLLIGEIGEKDIVIQAKQESWIDRQMSVFDFLSE